MEVDEETYSNVHRALLQAFMAQSTFTIAQAKPALAAIISAHSGRQVLDEDITEADFDSHVNIINAAISPFDLEIRSAWTQTTSDSRRERKYALVNTSVDKISELATTHTPDEIAYIRRLLDAIFEKNNTVNREVMGISQVEALRLNRAQNGGARASTVGAGADGDDRRAQTAGSLTGKEAEKMLQTLVNEDWLERSGDFYSVSARGLMELRTYLIETYNDETGAENDNGWQRIKMCQACKEIVTVGQRCAQKQCLARLHDHCVAHFFVAQRSEACPLCREPWTGQDFVGERAANRGAARGSNVAAGRRTTIQADDSDD